MNGNYSRDEMPKSKPVMPEVVVRPEDTAAVAYGHAGDGNVHLHPMNPEVEVSGETAKALLVKIYQVGVDLGGTISREHGLGLSKKSYLPIASGEAKIGLMKRLKQAFDLNNIMNPGKVL